MSEQQLENLWTTIPQMITSIKGLDSSSKIVYGYIDGWHRNGKECFATNETIGEWCGISERTASSSVQELIDREIVSVRYEENNKRFLTPIARVATPIATSATPLARVATPLARVATYSNKDSNNHNQTPPPSASVGEDAGYEAMMEMRLAKEKKANRKPVEVKEPTKVVRQQAFLDFLAVFRWAGTDDRWIYEAWMKALQAGQKPSELVLAAKEHARRDGLQFMGSPQSWLSNGKWARYAPKKVQVEAIKPLFPSVSDMVAKNCSNDEIELISTKYDIAKSWWNKQAKPTIKEMLEYLKKNA